MRRFWFHIVVFLVLAIIQYSFFNVISSGSVWVPNILLVTVVVWMLRKNFYWVWWRAIALGLVYDMVSGGIFGVSALLLLWFSYGTSFISRRFLVDHTGSGLLWAGGLAGTYAVVYKALERTIVALVHSGESAFFNAEWTVHFLQAIPLMVVVNFILFFLWVGVIRRFDRFLFSDEVDALLASGK